MLRLLHYYGRFQGLKGNLGGMPTWTRYVLFVAAIPGLLGLVLSAVALCVSILALLLLIVPVYRVLAWVTGSRSGQSDFSEPNLPPSSDDFVEPMEPVSPSSEVADGSVTAEPVRPIPRRQIEVKIIE